MIQPLAFSRAGIVSEAPLSLSVLNFVLSSNIATDALHHNLISSTSRYLFRHCFTLLAILVAKKKYKPVAKKIQPVITDLPERFHIIHNIVGDPLTTLPSLNTNPLPFQPTSHYTLERKAFIDKVHAGDFLWPTECELMHHFMIVQQDAFTWNNTECGHFREDFFLPI